MTKEITEEKVREAISKVEHPTIAYTLLGLEMVRNIKIKGHFVYITLAFPFAGMAIEKDIVKSLNKPVNKLGGKLEVESTTMTQDELKNYFALEMQNPKGDI
jgi:metal-sulfur cluster biosynthetic enzyme